MNKKLPNILTVFRIFLVPLFPVAFFLEQNSYYLYAFLIFILAGITDILDGYLARKYKVISRFGTAMDPLADKLMLIMSLICLGIKNLIPLWILIIMMVKESIMIFFGLFMYFKREKFVIPANIFGKMATLFFTLAVVLILLLPAKEYLIYFIYFAFFLKLLALSSYILNFIKRKGHKNDN